MTYAWKDAGRLQFKTDAQIAGEVCSKLEREGRLTGKDLVEVSRPTDAPLHGEFLWDDTLAAEKYRESQARDIISHISIVSEAVSAEPVRAFLNVYESSSQYDSINAIIRDENKCKALYMRAIRELTSIQNRYNMIKSIANIETVIDEVRKEWNELE